MWQNLWTSSFEEVSRQDLCKRPLGHQPFCLRCLLQCKAFGSGNTCYRYQGATGASSSGGSLRGSSPRLVRPKLPWAGCHAPPWRFPTRRLCACWPSGLASLRDPRSLPSSPWIPCLPPPLPVWTGVKKVRQVNFAEVVCMALSPARHNLKAVKGPLFVYCVLSLEIGCHQQRQARGCPPPLQAGPHGAGCLSCPKAFIQALARTSWWGIQRNSHTIFSKGPVPIMQGHLEDCGGTSKLKLPARTYTSTQGHAKRPRAAFHQGSPQELLTGICKRVYPGSSCRDPWQKLTRSPWKDLLLLERSCKIVIEELPRSLP